MSSTTASGVPATGALTGAHKKVIFASSLGTVFEWYDFYLYGSLAALIGKHFFSGLNDTSQFIFALLAFAAGFAVRPFGALVFGRLGDMIGRKYTFLVTIVIMGLSTFLVGVLPSYDTIGIAAPIALISLRLLQGLAETLPCEVRQHILLGRKGVADRATSRGDSIFMHSGRHCAASRRPGE